MQDPYDRLLARLISISLVDLEDAREDVSNFAAKIASGNPETDFVDLALRVLYVDDLKARVKKLERMLAKWREEIGSYGSKEGE